MSTVTIVEPMGVPATIAMSIPTSAPQIERMAAQMVTPRKLRQTRIAPNAGMTKDLTITFDDSEWVWGVNRGNFVFTNATDHLIIAMRGKGLKLAPDAGTTFETQVPFVGAGGFQNIGAGTVKFAADTYKFGGTCYAADGATIDLSTAGAVTGAAFGGAGVVSGASFSGATRVVLDAADDWTADEVPTFSGCNLSAATLVVDYGRTAENPLDGEMPKQGILVAKLVGCTGTPRFRLKTSTTGLRGLGATFTVDPTTGEVRMSVDRRGSIFIFR